MKDYRSICLPHAKELKNICVTYVTLDHRKIHDCPVSVDSSGKYVFVPHIKSRIKTLGQRMMEFDIKEVSYNDYYKN